MSPIYSLDIFSALLRSQIRSSLVIGLGLVVPMGVSINAYAIDGFTQIAQASELSSAPKFRNFDRKMLALFREIGKSEKIPDALIVERYSEIANTSLSEIEIIDVFQNIDAEFRGFLIRLSYSHPNPTIQALRLEARKFLLDGNLEGTLNALLRVSALSRNALAIDGDAFQTMLESTWVDQWRLDYRSAVTKMLDITQFLVKREGIDQIPARLYLDALMYLMKSSNLFDETASIDFAIKHLSDFEKHFSEKSNLNDLARIRHHLGIALVKKNERLATADLLDEAIQKFRSALDGRPRDTELHR